MARRRMVKVKIDSEKLRTFIARKSSVAQIAKDIGWSEKTIRRGLTDGEMSFDLVMRLAWEIGRDAEDFADLHSYYNYISID